MTVVAARGEPQRGLLALVLLVTACAPIESHSEVSIRPREAPTRTYGEAETARSVIADYVQLGNRVFVELHEHEQCVAIRHVPVLRVEQVERRSKGFVAWDFTLGIAAGGFAALAFARPQSFTKPLISNDGRVVYNYSGAYVIGSVFTAVSVGLLTAGIVNAVKARDTVSYTDAFELAQGEPHPCLGAEASRQPLADRPLTLFVADGVLEAEAHSDAEGRARFELRAWPPELPPPATGLAPAVLELGYDDERGLASEVLELELRVPFTGMTEAHTGRATSETSAPAPIEGPRQPTTNEG